MNIETREQSMLKINFYLPKLTDKQLQIVAAFIHGIIRGGVLHG